MLVVLEVLEGVLEGVLEAVLEGQFEVDKFVNFAYLNNSADPHHTCKNHQQGKQ